MPASFANASRRNILAAIGRVEDALDEYDGWPVIGTALDAMVLDLKLLSIVHPNGNARLHGPLETLWKAVVACSEAGQLCSLPSRWPTIEHTLSYAPTPKLAREWARLFGMHLHAYAMLVASGEYSHIIKTKPFTAAANEIVRRLYGLKTNE